MHHRRSRARHARVRIVGKKVVYITEFRNAAIEVMKMYQKKGENAAIEREIDSSGVHVYVVYIFPRV